jgi:hypothetical protein
MKNITSLVLASMLFAVIGMSALTASRFQRQMADAQEQIATLQYPAAKASLDAAEGYLEYARWIPGVGEASLREVRARKAALLYWQGDYESVLPAQAEPVALVDESNVELQLVVANAAHRFAQARVKDRDSMLQALNDAASGYATVLRNDTWHEDAAYNYEYIVRLRDEIARGRRPPVPQQQEGAADLGEQGAPSPDTSLKGFQIYVPLEGNERTPEGGEAGKAGEKQRKG